MISLSTLGQPQPDNPFAQFGGNIEQPQGTVTPPQGNYPTPPTGMIWAIQPDGTVKLQPAPPANPQQDPNVSFDANGKATTTTPQATVAPGSAASGFTPTSTSGGGPAPTITNPNDPAQVRAWFQWRASQPGADPILQNPGGVDYYTKQTLDNGGLTDTNYWTNKSTLAQYGGAVGAGGGGGFGSLTAPYTGSYQLPSASDLQGMPGYQAALDAASKAVNTNAAARGLLNTGGTAKALQDAAIGTASQQYYNLANLGQNAFNTNYGIFRNNAGDSFDKLYKLSSLGANTATA